MKDYDLLSLKCFQLVYKFRSITIAAEKLNLTKAAVSKRIEKIEVSLGYPLFVRTTRKVSPTLEAEKMISIVEEIFGKIHQLENNFDKVAQTQGRIRISCAMGMATSFFGEILFQYQQQNPQIEIELISTDSVMDLAEHNIDLTIRVNPSKISDLVGKKLGPQHLVAVATPRYLKNKPHIKTLNALSKHPLLTINNHLSFLMKEYPKDSAQLSSSQKFKTNDSVLISKLIKTHKGIGIRSMWDVKKDLESGSLELVLPKDYFKSQGEVWLLSSAQRLQSEKVRNLFDYLIKELAQHF